MDKLLHERLRDVKDDSETIKVSPGLKVLMSKKFCNELAHEIERYYIPRPRFEDGEPVKKGSKTDVCDVWSFDISSDGYWRLYDDDGVEFDYGEDGEFVKRPTPKVLDADEVEIKAGQEVYGTGREQHRYIVLMPHDECNSAIFTVKCRDLDDERAVCHCAPSQLTHEKPVFDAEGVRICKGDTVWTINVPKGHTKCTVSGFKTFEEMGTTDCDKPSTHAVLFEEGGWMGNLRVTHQEPDSLEKLRDFASEWSHPDNVSNSSACDFRDAMQEVTDRLTAIIEMGA